MIQMLTQNSRWLVRVGTKMTDDNNEADVRKEKFLIVIKIKPTISEAAKLPPGYKKCHKVRLWLAKYTIIYHFMGGRIGAKPKYDSR